SCRADASRAPGDSAPGLRARLEEPDQLHDVVRRDPPDRSGAVGGVQHAAVGSEQELARLDDVALGLVEGADAVGVLGDAEPPGDREAETVLLDRLARLL